MKVRLKQWSSGGRFLLIVTDKWFMRIQVARPKYPTISRVNFQRRSNNEI